MKIPNYLTILGFSLLIIYSSLSAQQTFATDPVGYVTETIRPASFNLIGVNLSSPVITAGSFESVNGTTVFDSEADFVTSLPTNFEYVLIITSGDQDHVGVNTNVSALSTTEISTTDDLSSIIADGTTYEIRKILTIADLFGQNNEADFVGAQKGDTTNADIIWIPNDAGGYTKIYYNETASTSFPILSVGWKSFQQGNLDVSDTPIYLTSGVIIQVKRNTFNFMEVGVDGNDLMTKKLILSGSVITNPTQTVVETGFNCINRIFPSDLTLSESKLELDIVQANAGDTSSADIIWVPNGAGGYSKYYYNGSASTSFPILSLGWKSFQTGNEDVSTAPLTSGFFIQRKGVPSMVTMRIPEAANL